MFSGKLSIWPTLMSPTTVKESQKGGKKQGIPEVAVFRGESLFDPASVETPADHPGVGVKIFSGVKSPSGLEWKNKTV